MGMTILNFYEFYILSICNFNKEKREILALPLFFKYSKICLTCITRGKCTCATKELRLILTAYKEIVS